MGFSVYCDNHEIWSPSLRVGFLFLDQMQSLERAFGVKSGVQSSVADELQIDAPIFDAFLRTVLEALEKTNNGPLLALCAGCVEISIALNASITGVWPTVPPTLTFLLKEAQQVMLPRRI